jgi:hypothetical protein
MQSASVAEAVAGLLHKQAAVEVLVRFLLVGLMRQTLAQ